MSEKIDASAEAVAQLEAWFTDAKQTAADLLDALVADRNSLRSKLAEAERERDRLQSVVLGKIDEQDDLVERLNDAEVERDAALSELAKANALIEQLGHWLDDERERADREIRQAHERFHHEHVYIMAQLEHYQKIVTDWAARQPMPDVIIWRGDGPLPSPPKDPAK